MNEYVDNEARKSRLVGKTVTMAHGAGGRQTSELIDMIFKAHFDNPDLTLPMDLSYHRHSIREEISESFPSAVRSMIFPVWEQNHYT